MTVVKYIAAGFATDAEKLLNSFVEENSLEFRVFATKFRESNFSLIYMGREKAEIVQFTHEAYQLTLSYLRSSSFPSQIGAVYLLYALYRNQVVDSFINIRLTLQQWEVIKNLYLLSMQHGYKSLHYVISFLYKNAFDFVAFPTLHGPQCGNTSMDIERPAYQANYLLKDVKSGASELLSRNVLQHTKKLNDEYEELKKQVFPNAEATTSTTLQTYIDQLNTLVNGLTVGATKSKPKKIEEPSKTIGSRRAEIKAAAFSRKSSYWQACMTETEEEEREEPIKPSMPRKIVRKRRVPANERRVGRPRKANELDQLVIETAEASPVKKKVGKRRRRGAAGKMSYLEDYPTLPTVNNKKLMELHTSSEDEEILVANGLDPATENKVVELHSSSEEEEDTPPGDGDYELV